MLALDAGNALFKSLADGQDPTAKLRAGLLLEQMGAQGYTAMAVGQRDLVLGVDFLKKKTKGAKLSLVSANLVDAKGQRLFPASVVTTAGELKVGIIGVSPASPDPKGGDSAAFLPPGVQGQPVQPAVAAEVKRLRTTEKVDVVVLLAAVPYAEAVKLAQGAEGVDFVVQSHDGRGVGMAQRQGVSTLIPPGERGRQVAKLEVSVEGTGPFSDQSEANRALESQRMVEANITRVKERLKTEKDEATRRSLQETLTSFEARRDALGRTAATSAPAKEGRTFLLSYVQLGADVASDKAVQQQVERVEPPGSAGH
ncbi:5'-nucleotidase [Corallococcus praedator]|uniref:5'-nucleotidase n=1 Tax=Corallococcus praedator TaxID=2316724 RepID=A0ABX9QEC5_9BACT|nr:MULTISPECIES: 5'-nucleotidase [Corallococcus]RKH27521.1 5'-nucleotidase [Corallococcus sp. CA031C]RKI02706.1 5'-nucleotidase [Corallococcus praedator]